MVTKTSRILLLAATALSAPVFAADAPASPAVTQVTAADTAAAGTDDTEIVVYGRGEIRSVAEVGAKDIALTTPGSSPFKAIEKLPGVNFQSADPFGAYEWSTRISLRGFNQNQLGFTLDGIPLGDMSYGNTNGLHISRAIISDNIGTVRVSQGAGALGTASTSNLGGTIEFLSRQPSDKFGIAANATYGSAETVRAFVGVDTGDLGGLRASLSYAHLDAGKWKGVGAQRSNQVNAKATYDFGNSGKITGFVNFSDRKENDYQDLSLDQISRLGYNNDNISNNFALARQIAKAYQTGTPFPAPYQTVDDVYYDAGGLRRDWLTGLKVEGKLAEGLTASLQGYYHHNKGQGSWFTPYTPSPGTDNPISFRTTEYKISREGIIGNLAYETGKNKIAASIWYENNDFDQARRFYAVTGTTVPSTTALTYQSNPFFTQWYNAFKTKTVQISLQDTFELSDQFSVSAGFKGNSVKLEASQIAVTNARATGNIKNEDFFQPQFGILYKIDDRNELYANYTENQRAFTAAATGASPFATTQTGFDFILAKGSLRPETSKTVEGGYRFGAGSLRGVVAVYYVDFSNRLIATSAGTGIQGNPTVLDNAGSVRSLGVETGLTWKIAPPVTLTASYAYNDSTYRADVGANMLRGKTVVDSPKNIANLEFAFDQAGFYARGNVNYMSKRYFTYTNDQSVPGRALVDAKIGYRFTSSNQWMNGLGIEGSVTNLTDKTYIATIGSNGYGFVGDNQTLLTGAPRQWFVTVRKDF